MTHNNVKQTNIPFSGDVIGGALTTKVVKLQNHAVHSGTATNGQVLKWINANSDWEIISTPPAPLIVNVTSMSGDYNLGSTDVIILLNGYNLYLPQTATTGRIIQLTCATAYETIYAYSGYTVQGSSSKVASAIGGGVWYNMIICYDGHNWGNVI